MPIKDTAAQNASLDNDYGATHGANSPAAHELVLFSGDPMIDGIEITGSGYAPAAVANDAGWPSADGGSKSRIVNFAAPTGPWDEADHWALRDPVSGTVWDCAPLTEPLDITSASPFGPAVSIQIFASDSLTDDF